MTEGPFGRVEPDGTVYVRLPDGSETAVGSFQAGSPEDALAYYGRKYVALATEVELLERRAANPDVAPEDVTSTLARLREQVDHPQVVGDLAALQQRLEAVTPVLEARRAEARARREQARVEARAHRERIVTDAEALVDSTQWKVASERLRALLEEWKTAPHVDRAVEQELWRRFAAARNAFDRRRRHHFAELNAHQGEAKAAKQTIAAEAEELAGSTDWGPTAARYRQLMDAWKATGRASRSDEQALWQRFRAAQDAFFAARSAAFAERDAGLADNLVAKQALVAEAETLLPVTDPRAARQALRGIAERWEAAGPVPRADRDRIEGRLRAVEDAVRRAEEQRWRRTNPEARARAADTVAQLTASIEKLEREASRARTAGDARGVERAEQALAARRSWLSEAERALAEFSEA